MCEQEEGCSKHAFYRTEPGARPEYCAAHRKVSYFKAMYPISTSIYLRKQATTLTSTNTYYYYYYFYYYYLHTHTRTSKGKLLQADSKP